MKAYLMAALLVLAPLLSLSQVFGPGLRASTGFTLLPRGERNLPNVTYLEGKYSGIEADYTLFADKHKYYSSAFYGFTAGLRYQKSQNTLRDKVNYYQSTEELKQLSIYALGVNKRSAWNNLVRFGAVGTYDLSQKVDGNFMWNTRPYHLDLYFGFGFDNVRPLSRNTDGLMWTLELNTQYSLLNHVYIKEDQDPVRLWSFGVKLGLYFQYDWYHYREWYNN